MNDLTPKQVEVLAYLRAFFAQEDRLPTTRELADHFGFYQSAAMSHLTALVKKGHIECRATASSTRGYYRFTRSAIELAPSEWIAVDLDGTLAVYDEWRGITHIGPPIPAMVARVKAWLAEGRDVRIFTARVGPPHLHVPEELAQITCAIQDWCLEHIGAALPVTSIKDRHMIELWDDRARRVETNTGAEYSVLQSRYATDIQLLNDRCTEHALMHIEASKRDVQANQQLRVENEALRRVLRDIILHDGPGFPTGTCAKIAQTALEATPRPDMGEVSDGYHTFNELYDHRCTLFLGLMMAYPELSWASTQHHDGSTWEGGFIAGIQTPAGAVTYHLPSSMWGLAVITNAKVLERAPEWDGHTSADVITRLKAWMTSRVPPLRRGAVITFPKTTVTGSMP